jgi:hypothetical protein
MTAGFAGTRARCGDREVSSKNVWRIREYLTRKERVLFLSRFLAYFLDRFSDRLISGGLLMTL